MFLFACRTLVVVGCGMIAKVAMAKGIKSKLTTGGCGCDRTEVLEIILQDLLAMFSNNI